MQVVLVYLQPFRRNSLKCVSQPRIAKNSLKPPILGVQGHSRSSMFTFLRSSLPVLVMISNMSVPICNHFHVRRANSGRIMSFKSGAPLSPPRSWGPLSPSGMKFCHEILETLSYYIMKTRSLYLYWFWNGTGSWRTDRQTDRITVANMRYSWLFSRVKTVQARITKASLSAAWNTLVSEFVKLFHKFERGIHPQQGR